MKIIEVLSKKLKMLQAMDAQICKLEKLAMTFTFEECIIKFNVEQLTTNQSRTPDEIGRSIEEALIDNASTYLGEGFMGRIVAIGMDGNASYNQRFGRVLRGNDGQQNMVKNDFRISNNTALRCLTLILKEQKEARDKLAKEMQSLINEAKTPSKDNSKK